MNISASLNNVSAKVLNGMTNSSLTDQRNTPLGYHLPGLVTFATYAGVLTLCLSLFFDFLILIAFFRRPRLITPFTIQFLNSVLIQLFLMLYDGPLSIASHINRNLLRNPIFCAIFKLGAWTFPSLALLQQMVIGADRWSALLAPVWYRGKTVRYGIQITLSMVVFYLVLYLPLFIADTVTGVPVGQRCDIHHTLGYYRIVVRVLTYYFPLCFTYVSYPLLLMTLRKRRNAQIHAAVIRTSECSTRVVQ